MSSKKWAAIGFALIIGGCGTTTRGAEEVVTINVEPRDATVTTSLGHRCQTMPCTVKVARRAEFTVTAQEEGYEPQVVNVGTRSSKEGRKSVAGNMLMGGVVGMAVDTSKGVALDHFPNPVNITLIPVGQSPNVVPSQAPASVVRPTGAPAS